MNSYLRITFLILLVSPIQFLDGQINNLNAHALDPRFIAWLNRLFYLPPEGELRVRKEYRLLTDEERSNFHRAIRRLKADTSVPPNKYDALASLHHFNTAEGAHGGPGFLGWHRVYVILFENALRQEVANVTIPYWDNTLDAALPDPRRSITWSPLFLGNGQGRVRTGPFANFNTPFGQLRRNIGSDRRLMNANDIRNVMSRRWLWEISNPSAADRYNLELLHNHVHVWIGEQMSRIESSSYDPAFFVHHAFVDCLWEEFRQQQRSRGINPGRDYPRIVGENTHQPLVNMGLGRLMMIDGVNEIYTRRIYRCDRRPTCVQNSNTCGSPYLRCDWTRRQCLPLIMRVRPIVQRVPWWRRWRTASNDLNSVPIMFG